MNTRSADALIVGAGPTGLSAAIELRRLGVNRVLVVDREAQAGGMPRHCNHIGFGWADMHRFMFGPAYAARYVRLAEASGVEICTETTVNGWQDETRLLATTPDGRMTIEARAVLLATGCRERPRAARLVPGSRPQGVFTTGALQNFVFGHHQRVGKRALIVGADHVGFSAVLTLKESGTDVIALVTDLPRHQSFLQYKLISADRYRVPVYTNWKVSRIIGQRRLEAVELTHTIDGSVRQVECDTVVFTGDWIPDYELAFSGHLQIDTKSKSPTVNQSLQSSVKGVFAAGNLIHAAETADVAALSGRYAARRVQEFLTTGAWLAQPAVSIALDDALAWISPAAIVPGVTVVPHGHFILRAARLVAHATVEVWQADRCLWRKRNQRLVPNLPVYLADVWLKQVQDEVPVRVEVHS